MVRVIFAMVFSIVCFIGQALAHDFWIEKKEGKYFIVSGHGETWEPYDPTRVKEVKALTVDGKAANVDIIREKDIVTLASRGDLGLVQVFFDNQYWVNTTEGWKNITKREAIKQGLQIIESCRSHKYAKYIEKWSDLYGKPTGMRMEILPMKNPFTVKQGEKLQLKVILDGIPVENAAVFVQGKHDEIARTDKNGQVAVSLDMHKMNIISVKTNQPLKDEPDADQIYLRTSLSFGGK